MTSKAAALLELAKEHERIHVLLTMPDGTFRTLMNMAVYEEPENMLRYGETRVNVTTPSDTVLLTVAGDRLAHAINPSFAFADIQPVEPGRYRIVRLTDGQSFPIETDERDAYAKIGGDGTHHLDIPGHGYRSVASANIVCIDEP